MKAVSMGHVQKVTEILSNEVGKAFTAENLGHDPGEASGEDSDIVKDAKKRAEAAGRK